MRFCILRFAAYFLLVVSLQAGASDKPLRIAVLDSSAPMSFRDTKGELTGFTIGIIRAICEEMRVSCHFKAIALNEVTDVLTQDEFDMAAIGLLDTPERRAKILMSKPIFRSRSVWLAKNGIRPNTPGLKVAVVLGSAQESYVRANGWKVEPLSSNDQSSHVLQSNQADAALIPMPTALGLMQQPGFPKLGLMTQVMDAPGLGGDACFGISPRHPELKVKVDAAIERIKRNGRYDKINSEFLPFRVD